MEEALVAYLLADSGLASVVGDRVFWVRRPQHSDLPAVVMHKVSAPRAYTMQGPDGLIPARVQFDCWGATYAGAKIVGRAVIASLSGQRFIQSGVTFRGGFVADEDDGEDDLLGGGRVNRSRVDIILWHSGE